MISKHVEAQVEDVEVARHQVAPRAVTRHQVAPRAFARRRRERRQRAHADLDAVEARRRGEVGTKLKK